jgi:hypothetical protein
VTGPTGGAGALNIKDGAGMGSIVLTGGSATGLYSANLSWSSTDEGNSNLIGGHNHAVGLYDYNLVGGNSNTVNGEGNAIFGDSNNVSNNFNIIGGEDNTIQTTHNIVGGSDNTIPSSPFARHRSVVVGQYNIVNADEAVVGGKYNVLTAATDSIVGGQNNEAVNSHVVVQGSSVKTDANYGYYLAGYKNDVTGDAQTSVTHWLKEQVNGASSTATYDLQGGAGATVAVETGAAWRVDTWWLAVQHSGSSGYIGATQSGHTFAIISNMTGTYSVDGVETDQQIPAQDWITMDYTAAAGTQDWYGRVSIGGNRGAKISARVQTVKIII